MHSHTRNASLVLVLALFTGACGEAAPEQRGRIESPKPALETWRGPEVVVDGARLAKDRDSACASTEKLRISLEKLAEMADAAGMLPDDLESLRGTVDRLDIAVTLRDSNHACKPHLLAGMESKGHDVMTKTFVLESLPKGFEHLAGTVSTLVQKPHPGEVLSDPLSLRYLTKDGKPLTCDYDLMDVIGVDGSRIVGESPRDLEIREQLNVGLPLRGEPPHRVDRIKHGAQAEYPNYLRAIERHGQKEEVHLELMRPEHPVTLIDKDGKVYRLVELEDALNFYQCIGASLPPEWNLAVRR